MYVLYIHIYIHNLQDTSRSKEAPALARNSAQEAVLYNMLMNTHMLKTHIDSHKYIY